MGRDHQPLNIFLAPLECARGQVRDGTADLADRATNGFASAFGNCPTGLSPIALAAPLTAPPIDDAALLGKLADLLAPPSLSQCAAPAAMSPPTLMRPAPGIGRPPAMLVSVETFDDRAADVALL